MSENNLDALFLALIATVAICIIVSSAICCITEMVLTARVELAKLNIEEETE